MRGFAMFDQIFVCGADENFHGLFLSRWNWRLFGLVFILYLAIIITLSHVEHPPAASPIL